MCGIFGIILAGRHDVDHLALKRMGEIIKYRGPDHSGVYLGNGVALGNNRLSIIDLSSGNQPIFNEDRSLVIVYNGEIYNHLEIRKDLEKRGHRFSTQSDTEMVLHAFEEFGVDCLQRFNGMFAFAILDIPSKKLFLARDRLGIKPLYLAACKEGIAFASEPKALLHLLPIKVQPDWTSIYRYFSYGYIPPGSSAYQGIEKILPGHYAWVNGKTWMASPYWMASYGDQKNVNPEKALERVRDLLRTAVKLELMADVPVGVFLSGGLDSSAVALFAKEQSGEKVHSFALRFEEPTHDESADSRLVAHHLGLQHHEITFSANSIADTLFKVADILDEPFGDSTVLPLLVLSEFARNYVKVVLTGWGGDEIFAGYPTYLAHKIARYYRKIPKLLSNMLIPAVVARLPVSDRYMSLEFKAKRFVTGTDTSPELQHFQWMGYFDDSSKNRLFKPEILEQAQGDTLGPVVDVLKILPEKELIDRIMHLDSLFFLEGNGLFQADRLTMAASLEARVPLLNVSLFEYVAGLPADIKIKKFQTKSLLRKAMEPFLPRKIVYKPKKGFGPPSSIWTRGILSQVLERIFLPEKLEKQGIFQPDVILRLMREHQTRKADHGRKLWALLSFQLWYDNFILGRNPL